MERMRLAPCAAAGCDHIRHHRMRAAVRLVATASLLGLIACQTSASGGGLTGGASGAAGSYQATGGAAAGGNGGGSSGSGGGNAAAGGSLGTAGGAGGAAPGGGGGGGAGAGGTSAAGGTAGTSPGGAGGQAGQGTGPVGRCPFSAAEQLLWSGVAPGSAGITVAEVVTERSTNPQKMHDRTIAGVTKPTVLPYLAAKPNGAAAIVLPGGGYTHLAYDNEGTEIATWLNSVGVSAFVVKYRLPVDFPGSSSWVALADAQRALRVVRKSAAACKIDPARIGVVGFSAGGHLASQLETRFSARVTPAADDVDAIDARPAFGVLMYPVISMDPAIAHAGSKSALLGANPTAAAVALASSELQVTSTTPATFIGVSTRDTTVNPENSVRFDKALIADAIPQELHLYQDGAHGTGIHATGDMAAWPMQCVSWLTKSNFLSGPTP